MSRDEFKIFVTLEAEIENDYYTDVQDTATEDTHFSGKDIDGDGLLTPDELAYNVIVPNHNLDDKSYGSGNKTTEPATSETPDSLSLTDEEDVTPEAGG